MARQNPPSATNTERAESNSAGDLKLASHSISAEDRHAAFCAGLEQGRSERVALAIEDHARAMLLDWSRASLNLARQYADRTGPAWSALVMDCAESDD